MPFKKRMPFKKGMPFKKWNKIQKRSNTMFFKKCKIISKNPSKKSRSPYSIFFALANKCRGYRPFRFVLQKTARLGCLGWPKILLERQCLVEFRQTKRECCFSSAVGLPADNRDTSYFRIQLFFASCSSPF